MVLISIECGYLTCEPAPVLSEEGDGTEHPKGSLEAYPPGVAQFVAQAVAEGTREVYLAVAEEVFRAYGTVVEGEEDGLHHIGDIDEGDVLLLVAHSKVDMLLDALRHHEIVAFAWTIHPRGAQHDKREIGAGGFQAVKELFGGEFAPSVGGIRLRRVGVEDFTVGLCLAYRPEDAERTEVDETAQGLVGGDERLYQVLRAEGVHLVEVFGMEAFRDTSSMDNVVEGMVLQLFAQA